MVLDEAVAERKFHRSGYQFSNGFVMIPRKTVCSVNFVAIRKKNTISLGTKQNYHSNQKNNCQQLINIMMNGPDLNNFDFIETLDV